MSQTITKSIGQGDGKGELYHALAYDASDKFGGYKIKSLMLNADEKVYFRDSNTYIYSDASGSLIIEATTITLPATVIPNYNEGFTMLTTKKIQFRDTGLYINSSTDGQLDVVADTVLALDATTITLTGAITVTGAPTITGNVAIEGTVGITGAVTMATTNKIQFHDTGMYIYASANGTLAIVSDTNLTIAAATTHTGVFMMATTSKIQLRDAGIYLNSSVDGTLDVVADTVLALAATDITLTGIVAVTGTLGISDAVTMATNKKIQLRDTGLYIYSSADGVLDIVSDTTLTLTATTVTITAATNHTGAFEMQTTSRLQFHDTGMYIYASGDGALAIVSDTTLGVTCPAITLTSSTSTTVAGVLICSDETEASAVGTASMYTAGGLGVAKKAYIGTDIVMVAGDIDMSTAGTGTYDLIIKDNVADALSIKDDSADFMVITTTTGSDKVAFTPNVYFAAALTSTGRMYEKSTVTSKTSGANVTYTAAEMLNSMIIDAITEACTATTHTGTQIIAAIPNAVDGSSFWFTLENGAGSAISITLTAGADVTVTGTATVGQNNTKKFFGIVTSVASHTVTIYSIGTMVT